MGVYKINGIFQYVDDGLNIDESKPNNGLPTTSIWNTNTDTTNTSTTNYRLISERSLPGRNMFYESNKSVIVDRPNGYVLNGKNKYFTDIEKGEEIHNDNVRKALLVEFASFSGRPHLLEGKMDIFKYFLKTLYQNTTETDSVSKAEFFKSAYEDALKMGNVENVPYKEMFILYDEHTWHVRDVYDGGQKMNEAANIVTYWLDPLYETIGQTTDSSNINLQSPNNIATPSAPTTAQNLTYRVGREDDDENAIRQQIKENLSKIPSKPPKKSTPTIQEPKQSFTNYPTTGTRFITLPINASYTLKLLDRFGNEICAVPYNASQKRIELPINTLGSFYEIVPSKTRFYVHNGKGELLFEDATKHLDFSRLERFCMPLRDRKHAFVIMEHFLKDLSSYLLGTKKHFDSEIIKAIELFLYLFDRNKQRGKNYLECEMIDAIDRALADMVKG